MGKRRRPEPRPQTGTMQASDCNVRAERQSNRRWLYTTPDRSLRSVKLWRTGASASILPSSYNDLEGLKELLKLGSRANRGDVRIFASDRKPGLVLTECL